VIASAAVEGTAGGKKGFALALIVAATHLGSVLALAGLLWASRSARFAEMDQALKMGAGALLAVLGIYRVGRFFAGRLEREEKSVDAGNRGGTGWWLAGIAAGLIPCWDAVLLVLLAEANGRLALGIWVLTGFSAGLLLVQVLVAEGSRRVGPTLQRRGWTGLGHWLGLASGLGLAAIGLLLVGF
jgi:ABC-type nickel/cobalt efflux system permease component RcnA